MTRRTMRDSLRFALWRWQDIRVDGSLYLTKLYLLRTPWHQAALHWIKAPDPGRDLHDHPRSFISIVLRGGYVEDRPASTGITRPWMLHPETVRTRRRRFSVAFRRAEDAHRISHVEPGTLTLVLWGPKRRAWGFHTRHGWVPWRIYVGVEQEQP